MNNEFYKSFEDYVDSFCTRATKSSLDGEEL